MKLRNALILSTCLTLISAASIASDFRVAPKPSQVGSLNDLELCKHDYVRELPFVQAEVKKRYLDCDNILSAMMNQKRAENPAELGQKEKRLKAEGRAEVRLPANTEGSERSDANKSVISNSGGVAVGRDRVCDRNNKFCGKHPHDVCLAASNTALFRRKSRSLALSAATQRGIECNWAAYAQIHSAERARALNSAGELLKLGSGRSNYGTSNGRMHSYTIDGRTYNCSTLGNSTSCR